MPMSDQASFQSKRDMQTPTGADPFTKVKKRIWKDRVEGITKVATRTGLKFKKCGDWVDDLGTFWNEVVLINDVLHHSPMCYTATPLVQTMRRVRYGHKWINWIVLLRSEIGPRVWPQPPSSLLYELTIRSSFTRELMSVCHLENNNNRNF